MDLPCPANLGDLCRAIDHYCERTGPGLWAEPVNALTNLAFPLGATFLWSKRRSTRDRGLMTALLLAMAAVGFGSLLFHTVATRWAEWGDVLPILVFILLYLWLVLTRLVELPAWPTLCILLMFFIATFGLEAWVPGDVLWGGALYLPTLLGFIIIGLLLRHRRHPAGPAMLAALCVFGTAFLFRSVDSGLCESFPLGTHFMWHILNATLLFLLLTAAIRFDREEAPGGKAVVP